MRRGQRNKWTYDNSPQGEGIVVVHRDGKRREIHDMQELKFEAYSEKQVNTLREFGLIS